MEKGDKIPKEATEAYVASENQDVQRGVSTQQGEEEPSAEANEEEVEEGETYSPSQRIKSLQTDLTDLVTNIQTAADAKESLQRKELEEARRSRLERLENDMTFSLLKFEEISRGWSVGEQMETPQELQEALDNQKELCAALIAEKKELINELKKELKVRDDRYVKDLRKHGEEMDLMTERMEDQIETLMKAYREELAQIERVYQQQHKVLLTRGKTEWERLMKEFLDKELEGLTKRQKKVEEYETTIRNLILETTYKNNLDELELNAKSQVVEREHQRLKSTRMIASLKQINQEEEMVKNRFNLAHMRSRTNSLQTEIKKLLSQCSSQEKQFKKKNHDLLEDYKRNIQQYESLQSKIKHFAAADASKFEQMWLMAEAEVKQHVEGALAIDSLICRRLGFSWERPSMAFMERSGPSQAKKGAVQCNDRLTDASPGPKTQSTVGMVESSAELEQELSVERIMELLCDEVSLGFLVDDKPFNQLPPLEKTCSKLCALLTTLGIEEKDLPKLSHFLMMHKHVAGEQTEYVCVESGDQMEEVQINSTAHPNAELIDSKHVVPALKSFLEHIVSSREKATLQHCSFPHIRDASEDQVYWESMGNIIPEEKLKLWDITGKALKEYHMLLGEISEIIPETQSLEQQNKELQMLLQQTLSSQV